MGVHLAVGPVTCLQARSEDQDAGESGPAADAVHDGRAGEVPETGRRQPAAAPDPVAGDRVDEGDQEERKHDEREVHLMRSATDPDDDGCGRAGEDELEEELCEERDAGPRDGAV